MKRLNVALGKRSYPILIGSGLLSTVACFKSAVVGHRVVVISDQTVANHYLQQIINTLAVHYQVDSYIIPDGEQIKNLTSFAQIISFLLKKAYGKDTTLVALGGGVIGDLVGFVAACYQRGMPFIQVPTSLLAQVDSSVGGKTAVNHALGKNMIGAFYQPSSVIIDINCLQTLDARQFIAGMAEVIKYGIVYDEQFFNWLEYQQEYIMALDKQLLTEMIYRCCQIKATITSIDEQESGIRMLLNLGHTFGHALEAGMSYAQWLHGEAVAVGIVQASLLARYRGLLSNTHVNRINRLISKVGLPLFGLNQLPFPKLLNYIKRDKKLLAGKLRLVLPTAIGSAAVFSDITEQELQRAIVSNK